MNTCSERKSSRMTGKEGEKDKEAELNMEEWWIITVLSQMCQECFPPSPFTTEETALSNGSVFVHIANPRS